MILSTSVKHVKRSNKLIKTTMVYLLLSALCIAIEKIYALFGHGVSSAAMSYMFLYPLLGGSVVFALLWIININIRSIPKFRLYYNLYNSGIAMLTVGSMLKGVFEIAGTSSPFTPVYFMIGALLMCVPAIGAVISFKKTKPVR